MGHSPKTKKNNVTPVAQMSAEMAENGPKSAALSQVTVTITVVMVMVGLLLTCAHFGRHEGSTSSAGSNAIIAALKKERSTKITNLGINNEIGSTILREYTLYLDPIIFRQ